MVMDPGAELHLLVPGDWHTPTGGFRYDRRLVESLAAGGWTVHAHRLDGDWPRPAEASRAQAEAVVRSIPDGAWVVADGLAFGVLDDLAARHADRLRWVALVHHPLHLETGLGPAERERLRQQEARALSHARRVVVTSAHTALDVEAMGVPAARVAVVEPGTDLRWPGDEGPTRSADAAATAARAAGPVQLLCVATLTPRKGHATLLQALAGLLDLPWALHSVGSPARDPGTAARLRALAHQLGLDDRVVWHGEVDEAALQARYAAADLFVLPSWHEGYGMVVAEALAAGLPVIASDAGALSRTLPREAGWPVPPGDVPALQAALREGLGDPALRQQRAAAARAAARALPAWPAQALRFSAVLVEALA